MYGARKTVHFIDFDDREFATLRHNIAEVKGKPCFAFSLRA